MLSICKGICVLSTGFYAYDSQLRLDYKGMLNTTLLQYVIREIPKNDHQQIVNPLVVVLVLSYYMFKVIINQVIF